jgi:alpha-ketoglutarate-dependent taurine dioxygenase
MSGNSISAIDTAELKSRGWTSSISKSLAEFDLREQLMELASHFGSPAVTRRGGSLCDTLIPTAANAAQAKSLSKLYDVGEFPLHMDTAHWPTPCRYLLLACITPGSARRPTMLLDTRRVPINGEQLSLLHTAPVRVKNGRNSFFSTIASKSRPFIRFDPGCMTPTSPEGFQAMTILSRENWPTSLEYLDWLPGLIVIIDNWRVLHGRAKANIPDADRKLLRISIQ